MEYNASASVEKTTILGRVFNVVADKPKALLVVTRNAEDPIFNKFIIPCVGLDMPIYKLILSAEGSSVELIEKRQINRALQARYALVSQV